MRGTSPSRGIWPLDTGLLYTLALIFSTNYSIVRRPDGFLQRHLVCMSGHRDTKRRSRASSLGIQLVVFKRESKTRLTKVLNGKPISNFVASTIFLVCSGVRVMSSAFRFSRKCSTLRQPMMGKTNGVLRRWYAIATIAYHIRSRSSTIR